MMWSFNVLHHHHQTTNRNPTSHNLCAFLRNKNLLIVFILTNTSHLLSRKNTIFSWESSHLLLRKNTSSLTSSLDRKKQSKKQAGNRIPKEQASKCKKTETDQRKRVPKRKDMIKIVKSRGHERDAMAARLRSHSLYIASSCSSCFCNLPFPHKASDFALHPCLPQLQLHAKRIDVTTTPPIPLLREKT